MKILLVEDEPKIANAIARGLRQERFAVEVCYDGATGLGSALGDDSYDLMIFDRMLPEVEGLEIVQKVRATGKGTPILVLTAKGQVRDRVEGLNAGADDYLVKPFSFEELLARVRALLRRPQDVQDNILRVDDLTLDTVNYEVRRGKNKIKLTTTEFALLEYLMRNAGRVLSKDKLVAHVWDFDSDILPNTVEAYISALRRKIDKPFPSKKPLVQTSRGFGYAIGVE
ncbi:MAG: response regulator transcription factor [Candidatus Nomurabacteria bacterium]|jgi:two-component system copper resistance phosphate regulon response regulator CusR|nr:response regulator transcription factor [Candidatus Nomurabacteria bacterium]